MTVAIHWIGFRFRFGIRVISIKVVAHEIITSHNFLIRSKTIRAKNWVAIVYSRVDAGKCLDWRIDYTEPKLTSQFSHPVRYYLQHALYLHPVNNRASYDIEQRMWGTYAKDMSRECVQRNAYNQRHVAFRRSGELISYHGMFKELERDIYFGFWNIIIGRTALTPGVFLIRATS